jgi:hypothetical protein
MRANRQSVASLDDSGVKRVRLLIVRVPDFGCGVWLLFPGWQGGRSDGVGVVASFPVDGADVLVRLARAGR